MNSHCIILGDGVPQNPPLENRVSSICTLHKYSQPVRRIPRLTAILKINRYHTQTLTTAGPWKYDLKAQKLRRKKHLPTIHLCKCENVLYYIVPVQREILPSGTLTVFFMKKNPHLSIGKYLTHQNQMRCRFSSFGFVFLLIPTGVFSFYRLMVRFISPWCPVGFVCRWNRVTTSGRLRLHHAGTQPDPPTPYPAPDMEAFPKWWEVEQFSEVTPPSP